MNTTKFCSKCRSSKTAENFSKCTASKDGLHNWCKECVRAYKRSRYASRLRPKKEVKNTTAVTRIPPRKVTVPKVTFSIEKIEYRSRHIIHWQIVDQYTNCYGVFSNVFDARLQLKRLTKEAELQAQNQSGPFRLRKRAGQDTEDQNEDADLDENENDEVEEEAELATV